MTTCATFSLSNISGGRPDRGWLSDVDAFTDAARNCRTREQLALLIEQMRNDMGFDHHALISHVDHRDSGAQGVRIENYPTAWVDVFLQRELYRWDPIHVASRTTSLAFDWSEVPRMIRFSGRHAEVLESARREGLGHGLTVPIHIPGSPSGSCSFAMRNGRVLPSNRLGMAHLVGTFAYEAARKLGGLPRKPDTPKLTSRQLECTVLAGQGKTDAEIADLLGIKTSTVIEYLEAARARYGAGKRMQLVIRAIADGSISISDLL